MTGQSALSPRQFGRDALAYGAYLLTPVLLFGLLLGKQLSLGPGAGWVAIVAGCAGVGAALYFPSPRRRRASNREFLDGLDPSERERWEYLLSVRGKARAAVVLAPPAVCLFVVLGFTLARMPSRDPTLGEGVSVATLAAGAFAALTWSLQWLVVGWLARREESAPRSQARTASMRR